MRHTLAGACNPEDEDGVHGGRMKPLATCSRRKPMAGGKENVNPLDGKTSKGGMDMLLQAVDTCVEQDPLSIKKWKQFSRQRSSVPRKRKTEDNEDAAASQLKRPKSSSEKSDDDHLYSVCLTSTQDLNDARKDDELQTILVEEVPAEQHEPPKFMKAAVCVASHWLDLMRQDYHARSLALKRSKRRLRGVLEEFRKGERNAEYDKWMDIFLRLDADLSKQGSQLDASVKEMDDMLEKCKSVDFASRVVHLLSEQQQQPPDESRAIATACAASICSTAELAAKL